MAEGWQERLRAEHDELKERLGKLNRFIIDDTNLNDLSPKEVALLIAQTYAMTQLLDILSIRLTYVDK